MIETPMREIVFPGKVGLSGRIRVTIRKVSDGRIIADYWQKNKIVDEGLNLLRDLLGNSNFDPSHIAVGTGIVAPVAGDTTLGTEVFRNAITLTDLDPQKVTFQLFLDSGDANGNTLSEVGLFSNMQTDKGPMFDRALLAPTIDKDASITVTLSIEITISRGIASTIQDAGLDYVSKIMAGTELAPLYAAVGTDGTAWAAGQTALLAETFRELISRRKDDPERITYQMDLTTGDIGGETLREAGLFNASSGGEMLTRLVLSPVVTAASVLTWKYDIAEG